MPYANGFSASRFAGPGNDRLIVANNDVIRIEVETCCILNKGRGRDTKGCFAILHFSRFGDHGESFPVLEVTERLHIK